MNYGYMRVVQKVIITKLHADMSEAKCYTILFIQLLNSRFMNFCLFKIYCYCVIV